MGSDRPTNDWYSWAALGFLGVGIAIVVLRASKRPLGPWRGVYAHYLPFWGLLVGAAVVMLLVVRIYRVPWWVVGAFVWVSAESIVGISLIWGEPFGVHDSWTHLRIVINGQFAPGQDVYPLFHVLTRVLVETTGQSARWTITRMTVLTVTLGVLFALLVFRRLPVGRTAQQTALIVSIPALSAGLIPRPFSFALPYILLFYWVTLLDVPDSYRRRKQVVLAGVFVLGPYLHPLIALVTLIVGAVGWVVFERRSPFHTYNKSGTGLVVVATAVAVGTHFGLVTSVGDRVLSDMLVRLLGETAKTAGGPTDSETLLAKAFSNWSSFAELLGRSAYVVLLGIAVIVTLGTLLRRREVDIGAVIAIVATAIVGLVLVGLTTQTDTGVNIPRLLVLVPIVILPAIVQGLRARTDSGREVAVIAFCVLLVVGGVFGVFQSSLTGGIEESAGQQQVQAIDWLVGHSPTTVVGSRMTFWIVEGIYGYNTSTRLSGPTNGTGVDVTTNRNASYAWNVTDTGPNTLYVVDDVDRYRAFQAASEGRSRAKQCLGHFEHDQSRIYQNQDTSVYLRTTPAPPRCNDRKNTN